MKFPFPPLFLNDDRIIYIDRKTRDEKEELVYGGEALSFLYTHPWGRVLGRWIAKITFFSKVYGWWQHQPITKRKILPFIKKYGVDSTEFEKRVDEYPSFDAFFSRKLLPSARPIAQSGVIAPADGRYLFYENIATCDGFVVKGKKFSLDRLLGDPLLADRYRNGSMVIARLCPSDYHRFHFPCDCIPGEPRLMNGPLFSVNPIAIKRNFEILAENKRVVTLLKTTSYGEIAFLEVGAMCVGSIHQTYVPHKPYRKGDEKGFFSFGGSCLILLFEQNRVQFDEDLLLQASSHRELLCLFGQSLGNVLDH